ncbi:MAG: bifunctional diaminohydroxyphosphoribosylaminopyrimidine deaminase/5-amino-6-(5-phosphoribosylamino)uracil reductase RibD [Clostridia bacterium]|nr:bifunctional diaminohydroxyphosphoribosylaminopyrimidine deaminase/5-amino-6-(5-phosphoribosylamino)uracil reductase RibD [Clostridia bacterium]
MDNQILISEEDEKYMREALKLAKKGFGSVSPNPAVGAVIVRDGQVIGRGWHERYGGLHAERNALEDCRRRGNDPEGATIYVTLEPCCHQGKQPPCTEALIENKLGRVVYGSVDANPLVAGKGLRILEEHGIETLGPVLEDECKAVNEIFFHYITTGRPLVISKHAMTADGKIAAYTGDSMWVTGDEARHHTHEMRNKVAAIMVGIGTILQDDPRLTCRIEGGVDPVRVISDSHLRINGNLNVVKTAGTTRTVVAHLPIENEDQAATAASLREKGVELLEVGPDSHGHADVAQIIRKLGEMGIDSVLIEGGAELAYSAFMAGIVDKVQVYVAPKIIGGKDAKSPVGGKGIPKMDDALMLGTPKITMIGDDVLLEYDVLRKQ